MKFTRMQKVETDVTHLLAEMGVRYWEDGTVNGEEDDDASPNMPFAENGIWRITIDLGTGTILNWPQGTTAETHYKVCDDGVYSLLSGGEVVANKDGYVPEMLGGGDYVVLHIGPDGVIANWKADLDYFGEDE